MIHIKWQGHVTEISDGFFWADLDEIGKDGTFESMEMEIDKLPEGEKQFLELGKIFDLEVGEDEQGESYFKFEFWKKADFTPEEIEAAKKLADEWSKKIKWD